MRFIAAALVILGAGALAVFVLAMICVIAFLILYPVLHFLVA